MNTLPLINSLLATPTLPSRTIDPAAVAPCKTTPSNGFRLRSYTPDAYGASFHRPLYGRYTR